LAGGQGAGRAGGGRPGGQAGRRAGMTKLKFAFSSLENVLKNKKNSNLKKVEDL
jgi:hypothetical protein